ncbi:MAG TPA: hypothetical protein VFS43_38320 [Polyangiaceae bacterium]|nr:hypothetical protein [Polyangiaceae bacterium]
MGEVVRLDDRRGPWRNVLVVCGACGRQAVSTQQGARDGTYKGFGLECGGAKGCGGMTMAVLADITIT